MLKGIQLILIILVGTQCPVLKKKLLKPLKITNFWPNLCKNVVPMGHTQNKKLFFFFAEITKPYHVLAELKVMDIFLFSAILFC